MHSDADRPNPREPHEHDDFQLSSHPVTPAMAEELKPRWSHKVWWLGLVAMTVWGYLAYRVWLSEPQFSVRVLFFFATAAIVAILIRQCLVIRRTSLRVLVVGGPILVGIVSLPARQVVSHWQLRQRLTAAGVDDFALGTSKRLDRWLQKTASAVLGDSYGRSFNTDLTSARIQLELANLEQITRLPAEHLSLVTIRRSENTAAAIDSRLVDWLNSIPGKPLVSIRLQSPQSQELLALRDLRQLTMLKLRNVMLNELILDFPFVYDLAFESSTLVAPFEVKQVKLPKIERFTVQDSVFQMPPQLFLELSETQYVTFAGCTFGPDTLESVIRLPTTQLTMSGMSFPQELTIPPVDRGLGRSLITWDSQLRPAQLIEILRMRQSREAQICLDEPFSREEFATLISLPSLRFVRIQSPWLTKTHLLGLTEMTKQFRLSILDSTIPEQDAMWLKEHKSDSVRLYLQFALPSETTDSIDVPPAL